MSICYGIISEHGGEISVESIEGKGTTFIINLPIYMELEGFTEEIDTAETV